MEPITLLIALIGALMQDQTRRHESEQAEWARLDEMEYNEKQKAEERAYQDPVEKLARMKKAGINPNPFDFMGTGGVGTGGQSIMLDYPKTVSQPKENSLATLFQSLPQLLSMFTKKEASPQNDYQEARRKVQEWNLYDAIEDDANEDAILKANKIEAQSNAALAKAKLNVYNKMLAAKADVKKGKVPKNAGEIIDSLAEFLTLWGLDK